MDTCTNHGKDRIYCFDCVKTAERHAHNRAIDQVLEIVMKNHKDKRSYSEIKKLKK